MKHNLKRLLSVLLVLAMLVSVLPAAFAAQTDADEGKQATAPKKTTINVTLKASYKGYYTEGSTAQNRAASAASLAWGFQNTTGQAAAYESAADTKGTVVMATNGDYFNMGTGEPSGYLIMEGNAIKETGEPYFAILEDGKLATGSTEERDNLIALGWEDQGIGWYSCLK